MQQFIGTKLVNAKPMNRADYNILRGWELPTDEDGTDEGYLVEYVDGGKANVVGYDGYVSWSPAEVFNKSYRECDTYSDRLRIEYDDLYEKCKKLINFVYSDSFSSIPAEGRALLLAQSAAMGDYSALLGTRMGREDGDYKTANPVRLSFGGAVAAAQGGCKVARAGWNGSGVFAYIVPANKYSTDGNPTSPVVGMFPDDMVPYREYWALKTAQNDVDTWSPSGSDSLAHDWYVVA
jgi:hypothetical protein